MRRRLHGTDAFRSPYPWAALALALAFTASGWVGLERRTHEQARIQFERRTETAVAAVRSRIVAYEQILLSAAARMASALNVTREEWRSFISHLRLEERFPGIQSVGYAEFVRSGSLAEHVRRMRADGFPNYASHPAGERDEYVVIIYNEPFVGRNARVIGLDMYADPVRRAAIDRARDTGEAAITGRVVLAEEAFRGTQQPQQPGFVMYAPVFLEVARDLPRGERRNAVSGYAFGPFGMHDLMRGIFDEGVLQVLDMRIYDEPGRTMQDELIDTRTAWRAAPAEAPPIFERIVHFPMPGRSWTIQFISRPDFDAALRADKPWIFLGAGLLSSVVVFLLSLALVDSWNRARQLSMRDPLTGLYNRRYLDETIARELDRARRSGHPIGAIILDVDFFKQLNDKYGHDAGDFVLERTGDLLRSTTRAGDIACRFGGEEFAVILPGASIEASRARADAIRKAFNAMRLEFDGMPLGPFTLSAGVAALSPSQGDFSAVLRDADRALYTAKEAGRNRVVAVAE